jgi:hypothetical protein
VSLSDSTVVAELGGVVEESVAVDESGVCSTGDSESLSASAVDSLLSLNTLAGRRMIEDNLLFLVGVGERD